MDKPATLAELLKSHLAAQGLSARALAERLDASYPSVLAWLHKGGLPRKPEHREALRRELAIAPDVFARVLAVSLREPVAIPDEGPFDLRQILLKHLGEHNLTERTFADLAGIPYATIMGITRRNAVPRAATIERIAQVVGLPLATVQEAAGRTREAAAPSEDGEQPIEAPLSAPAAIIAESEAPPEVPGGELARTAAERIAASGMTAAAYARTHDLPYLALSSLIATGREPENPELLAQLRAAFPVTPSTAPAVSGAEDSRPRAAAAPRTRGAARSQAAEAAPAHALHAALRDLMQRKGWTQQRFAEVAGLAPPTAAKLLRGELPGRGPTHQKLRTVLEISESEYRSLLPAESSAAASASEPPAAEASTTQAPKAGPRGRVETDRLTRAIGTLDNDQRNAVWKLVEAFNEG